MEKSEFLTYFNCFDDGSGNAVGKGIADGAFIALQYEESTKNIPAGFICSQWKKYIDNCIEEKTPDRFIMSMESFISKARYNENFGATLKSKQSSFLDKYDKYKNHNDGGKSSVLNYLLNVGEGPFGVHFDNEEQRKTFMRELKNNNPVFAEKNEFIIIPEPEDQFRKIKLIYECRISA